MKANSRKWSREWCPQPKTSAPRSRTGILHHLKRSKLLYAVPITLLVTMIVLTAYFLDRPSIPFPHEPIPGPIMPGLWITNVDWDASTGKIKVLVRNTGAETVALSEVYVNETLDPEASIAPRLLPQKQTAEITLSKTYRIMPKQITVEVHTDDNFRVSRKQTFIGFKMLGLYWNESTGKIRVRVENTGDYPKVNFGKVYVNGTIDDAIVITQDLRDPGEHGKYEIALSRTYLNKPTSMRLRITTVEGTFELASPFTGTMTINSIRWDEITGRIKFLVYVPGAHYLDRERDITFDEIYFNCTLDESAVISRNYSETYEIASSRTCANKPTSISVRVVTDFGAYEEVAKLMR